MRNSPTSERPVTDRAFQQRMLRASFGLAALQNASKSYKSSLIRQTVTEKALIGLDIPYMMQQIFCAAI